MLISGLFIGSCAMIYGSDSSTDIEIAPECKLAAPNGNVVLINNYDFAKQKIKNEAKLEEVKSGVTDGLNAVGSYLAGMTGGKYDNIADTATLAVNTGDLSTIAAKYQAAYIVALTNFYYSTALEKTEKRADQPLKEAYFSLQIVTAFTVYNAQGQKLREFTSNLSEPFTHHQAPGSLIAFFATPSIKSNISSFNRIVKNSMLSAFKPLLPTKSTISMHCFYDPELRAALKESDVGHIDSVQALLKPLIGGTDTVLAGKAAYNLAAAYCAGGRFTEAKEMAEISSRKFVNPKTKQLLNDLTVRESVLLK